MADACRSKLVNVVSGVPQGSVLGPLLFLLHTSELFFILENKLIGYADDSTLMAVVPSPGVKVAVAETLIHDLGRVSEWCDLWGMKLNVSENKTMIISRSRIMHPQLPPLTIGGTVLKESADLVILGVTFSDCRPLAVLCMLYKIRCNQVQPVNGGLPVQYVPVRVTRGTLVAHRYTYAPLRCRTLQ